MLIVLLVSLILFPFPSSAEITKLVIEKREPFAKTKEEREKRGDPRLSIEERYNDQAEYVQRVSQAARTLVDDRFLLPEDAERLMAEAKKNNPFVERKSQ